MPKKLIEAELPPGPFYSERNMAYLGKAIEDFEAGSSIPKEHELIEEAD